MSEKEKKLNALLDLKENLQKMIKLIDDSSQDQNQIDFLLENLSRVIKEIEKLKREIKNEKNN